MTARGVLLLFVFLLLSSVLCTAQDAPDNSMLKLGPFSFQPSLIVRDIGEDKNVFNEATNPKSDFTMTVSPKADVIFHLRRFKTTFTQATDYVYFKKYASERGTNQSNALRSEFDLGILQPFVAVTLLNTKARLDNEVDARARHTSAEYTAGLGIKVFTRTNVTLRVRQSEAQFAEGETFRGESLARAFNGRNRAFDGSVGVGLTPLTSLAVVFSKEEQRFDQAPERDSDTFRVMPTFTFSPLGLLNGSAAFGYRRFTARDPRTPNFTGFVTQVTAGITVFDHHRLDTVVVRDLTYSYDQAATYFITNSVSLTWTYAFAGPFDSRVSVGRNLMQYHKTATSDAGGNDTYTNYEAGLGYRLPHRIRLGVNGNYAQRQSKLAGDRAFNNHRIYGTLTWGG